MTTAAVPHPTFIPNTTIASDEVNANFQALVDYLNTQVVTVDASKAFTGVPSVNADPTSANQLTRKSYVDALNVYNSNVLKSLIPKIRVGTFEGSTDAFSQVTVTHGLGVNVQAALATINGAGSTFGGANLTATVVAGTTTTVTFHFWNDGTPYANGTVKFHWLAYGGMGV